MSNNFGKLLIFFGLFQLFELALVDARIKDVQRSNWQYCVIGAGPGGLQIAYFMQQAHRNYIVFEKGLTSGTFYTKFPIHRKLISINKRKTGKTNKEFNMRHDWNSLLSDDESLRFTNYAKAFFPGADSLVNYFNDFATKHKLNILYNTTISNITKEEGCFLANDEGGKNYECEYVIVATGMAKPYVPTFEGSELVDGYEELSLDLDEYVDKKVLIIGHGNSAFEVAEHIMPVTRSIDMMARRPLKMAWTSHYVGDLRAVNAAFLNTALQSTLDDVKTGSIELFSVFKRNRQFYLTENNGMQNGKKDEKSTLTKQGYDKIIRCTGFEFDDSIFNKTMTIKRSSQSQKYPRISQFFESTDVKNLYFAGANTHSLDLKKSAGAFIHGYRYSARALHRLLEWKNHGNKWNYIHFNNLIDLISHLAKRFNEASDLYQMFGVLCDVVVYNSEKTEADYLEAFPCALASELPEASGHDVPDAILLMSMEYGRNPGVPKQYSAKSLLAHQSHFLHPVFYHYKKLFSNHDYELKPNDWILPIPDMHLHIVEDFLTKFDGPITHLLPLRRFIEKSTGQDLRLFFAEQCLMLSLTTRKQPLGCHHNDAAKSTTVALSAALAQQLSQMDAFLLPFESIKS